MIRKRIFLFVFLFGGLAGAASPAPRQSQSGAARAAAMRGEGPTEYRIGPGDVLGILTWKEADFSGTFAVRFDGRITLPLVGDVDAAGRTPQELAEHLEEQIGRLVELARVTVAIEQSNAQYFVIGKVGQQGAFPYTGAIRVVQALALAGGLQEFAKRDRIFIIRDVNGQLIHFPFSYEDLVDRRSLRNNLVLLPGDTIVVP